ncbi:MAG: SGNH/GDSL hydrolase family protein [Myxococcales bacterium]|nr:SGNH/GDSL hydrolase family protein [Myxococcales bacterium]
MDVRPTPRVPVSSVSARGARSLAAFSVAALCACGSPGDTEVGSDSEVTGTTGTPEASASSGTTDSETAQETDDEPGAPPPWIATWGSSPTEANAATVAPFVLEGQSLRQVAHISVGGEEVRVRLANTFGESDLPVTEARLALAGEGAATLPASDRLLTVDGATSFLIPAGAIVVSDPVALEVPARSDLSVSLYFAERVMTTTVHAEAHQTAWLASGDLGAASSWPAMAETRTSAFWLNGIEVKAPSDAALVVALGDSITDGAGSTLDANRRWPDRLAERLLAEPALEPGAVAVVNAGVGGNCVLRYFIGPPALERFDRDVLDQRGVRWVIITEGINDIGVGSFLGQPVAADELIAGYLELIARAHARGLLVYGGTLLPYEGAYYYSEDGEQVRQAVNEWIRTSGEYDAVIDFDVVTRDPDAPARLLPEYDAGDHLHPSDAGYAAMANAVELALFW